ncbi:MAG TPA: hypothetical protein VHW72_00835, partial [Candidatus Angelobacter sp.]|nr:hypothetical protein [Candidatus Angelobacter sp.]
TSDIVLSDYKTIVPNWYSEKGSEFSKSLEELLNDCLSSDLSKHMILTAPGGVGKSALLAFLHDELVRNKKEFELVEGVTKKDVMEQHLRALFHKQSNRSSSLISILAIDEALGGGFQEVTQARIWLEEAKKHSVRLLLVDANFIAEAQDSNYSDQVIARCHRHVLMTPDQHPRDIPYIIAGIIDRYAPEHITAVDIQGDFLLAFVDAMLEEPRIREWEEEIKQAVEQVFEGTPPGQPAKLTSANLSRRVKRYLDSYAAPIAAESWYKLNLAHN